MQQLGEYVLSLTAAAMICGGVLSVVRGGSMEKILRLVCGVFLTITALRPLSDISIPDPMDLWSDYQEEASQIAAWGEEMYVRQRDENIKQQLEAYIQDKASRLGADLIVTLSLDTSGIPVRVELHGEISESAVYALSKEIALELGIEKENQQWTG